MKTALKYLPLFLCAMLAAGCAKNMSSNTYSSSSTAGKVLEGKVVSVRAVTIKDHDKLQDNTLGGLAGGGAGALAGSQIGRGNGSIAGALGGALVGAVGGALIQDQLSTSQGTEYLVKIDKDYLQDYHTISKKIAASTKTTVEQDMTSTNVGTKSDIVSVVQATDPAIQKGSHVYIIYNDDRPRITLDD